MGVSHNLDHCLRDHEPRYNYGRAVGVWLGEMVAIDLIHLGEVFFVRQIDENLCHIREAATCRLKRLRKVAESEFRLLFDAAGLDAAIRVYGNLGSIENAIGRDSPFDWCLFDGQ